eukprot:gene3112-5282_t
MSNKIEEKQHTEVCLGTSSNGTSLIWDIKTGDIIGTYYKNKTNQNSTCFSNYHIFSSQNDKPAVHVYSLKKEQPVFQCSLSEKLTCIQNSSDGNYLFAGSESGLIYVWKICTGQLIKIFSAHLKSVTALCLTPDSSILISGGSDTLIHVWSVADILDVKTKNERKISTLKTFSNHSLGITSLSCSLGSHTKIISSSHDRTVKIFHLSSGIELCSIGFPSAIEKAILNYSEHILYAGASNGKIYETDLYPMTPQFIDSSGGTRNFSIDYDKNQIFKGHSDSITDITINEDNSQLLSSAKDGACIIWDTTSKQVLKSLKNTTNQYMTNLQVMRISKEVFTEKPLNIPQVSALKKFVNQDENLNCSLKLDQDHWKDLMELDNHLDISPFTSNLNTINYIQGKEMNIYHQVNSSWLEFLGK